MNSLIPLALVESDRLDEISSINNNLSGIVNQHRNDFSFQVNNNQASIIPNDSLAIQVMPLINRTNTNEQQYTNPNKYIKENKLNKRDAHVKVTVIKNMVGLENNLKKEYFINDQGLVDTKKNTDSQDIMIGRQEKFEFQGQCIFPNDIVLHEQERLISRIHCKLICKNFFRKDPYIQPLYKNTLRYLKYKLTHYILLKIQKFLEDPKECYVQDIGSVFGTYIRVDKKYQKLQKSHTYSIGTDTIFQIQECHVFEKNQKPIDEHFDKLIDYIKNSFLKCNIHGLSHESKSNESLYQIQSEKQPIEMTWILNQLKQYNVPFILLLFSGSGLQGCYLHYFFAKDCNIEFSMGRCNENNIRINSNTISRKQTRIRFNKKENKWQIADGSQDRESANGTWLQLSTIEEKEQKLESQPHPLKHLSEIKINDYILKVELFEAKKQKKSSNKQFQQSCN
ncbi:unnamed protein product [Paramecium sonneborni]|uniref:FHA domain-containing protein n=1 Tax=Paramecium sonneborni TaxID=65129 RepID=A0A8S1N6M7_9CILI|nr:unnamed protein product [Paramecium sonneborni]